MAITTPHAKYLGTQCTRCRQGIMVETNNSCEWWVRCDDCSHMQFCYEPMPHQQRFHRDTAKFKMYAGGKIFHSLSLYKMKEPNSGKL